MDVGYILAFAAGGALAGAGLGCLAEAVYTAATLSTTITLLEGGTGVAGVLCADGDPTNEIEQTSKTINCVMDMLKQGKRVGQNIITQINDTTQIIFRNDCHPIKPTYVDPVNHINIEIQILNSADKWTTKWNMHIILDEFGKAIEKYITGPWA